MRAELALPIRRMRGSSSSMPCSILLIVIFNVWFSSFPLQLYSIDKSCAIYIRFPFTSPAPTNYYLLWMSALWCWALLGRSVPWWTQKRVTWQPLCESYAPPLANRRFALPCAFAFVILRFAFCFKWMSFANYHAITLGHNRCQQGGVPQACSNSKEGVGSAGIVPSIRRCRQDCRGQHEPIRGRRSLRRFRGQDPASTHHSPSYQEEG